jgi:hypothetical protein
MRSDPKPDKRTETLDGCILMYMRTANMLMIAGGVVTIISVFLVWATGAFGDCTLWGLRDCFDFKYGWLSGIARICIIIILFLGTGSVIAGIRYLGKTDSPREPFISALFNSITLIVATVIVLAGINDSHYDIGYGAYVAFAAAAMTLIAAALIHKEMREHLNGARTRR